MARVRKDSKYLFDNIPGYGSKYPKRENLDIPAAIRQQIVEVNMDQLIQVVSNVPHSLEFQLHNFAVDVSIRALVVFKRSFTERKFYSADGAVWPALTPFTIKTRERRGTWPGDGILREYGNLYSSLSRRSISKTNGVMEQVYTDPKQFPKGRAYGGVHNDPRPSDTYGTIFGAKPVKRRQFMGFSTYIDNFEEQYIDRYLFHAVFGLPQTQKIAKIAKTNVRYY